MSKEEALRERLDALALYLNAKRFWRPKLERNATNIELERRDAISQAYEDSLDAANNYCWYIGEGGIAT